MSTVREIAKIAGVSPSTVSRVLNGNAPVNQATREAVLSAIKAQNYTPKKKTSGNGQKPAHIVIIMPQGSASNLPEHPTIYSIMSSFVSYLETNGVSNSIMMLDERYEGNTAELFLNPADGYLVMCTSMHQEDMLLPYFKEKNIPYIIVNRWVQQKHCNYVNIDDVQASYDAMQYLIKLGHRKIAYVGGDADYRSTQLRLKGYSQALAAAGLPLRQEYILTGEYTSAYGELAAEKLMGLPEPPTAGFFASDTLAIGSIHFLTEHKYRLPEDFSIIGYGDISVAPYIQPALTTIRIPEKDMGIQAAIALLNLISNSSISNVQVLLEAKLIVRRSCAPRKE